MLRGVRLPEGIRDVAVRDGRIAGIATRIDPRDAEVVDGDGGALLPGLHDHHLHLHATAAAGRSVECGPPRVRTAADLAAALAAAPGDGWIRGVGYVETVAGLLDSTELDRLHAGRPVRLQHRGGALWILNSAAARQTGLADGDHPGIERDATGAPTGRVWRADAWLRDRLPAAAPPPLDALGAELARYGITGVTDATPDLSPATLRALLAAHRSGALPQRPHLLGVPLGTRVDGATAGPFKIVLADHDAPDLAVLIETIRVAHAHGRPVAAHCVSRVALLVLLAALDEAGSLPGDRIEHGAIIPVDLVPVLAQRKLCVVSQPGFLAHRGDDYRARVDPDELPDLYRCRSLVDAGVPLALSSDAPYGPLDPWSVIAAAVHRRTPDGGQLGAGETLSPAAALGRYLTDPAHPGGAPRRIRAGGPADLVLLDRALPEALLAPASERVRCTVIAGAVRYRR